MSSTKPFVHLHCHTDYSLLDGACEITQLMDLAVEQQMPAVAMTDHGNLFGAVEFYNAAREKGVHPVIGCEVYVSQQGRHSRNDSDHYNHLLLLCENQEGYRNLIRLVSTGYLEGFYYKPRIDKDLLAQHSKGLICMSACLRGDVNETILSDRYEDARRLAHEYQDLFGRGNFFLEIQDHGLEKDKLLIPGLRRLAADTGIPMVATNDAHYMRRKDARPHEILLCVQTGKTMKDPQRMRFDVPEFYLKTRAEMEALFGDMEDALDRTWDIAQRCQVKLEPVAEPFPRFDVPEGHSADTWFEYVARQGFERRRGRLESMRAAGALKCDLAEYAERLDREIHMIQQMKFSGYFLIVWDFIRFAKSSGIPVGPGRGSAAGSLVSYSMEITDIDPLQYGLLFERFLNPERISMPDIDIDFHTRRRGEVIQYVTEKYGREQVAQIITFGTLGARQAIKDVGRVLDMTFAEVDRVTKLVPNQLNIKLKDAIKQEPGFAEAARKDARVEEVLDVAQTLEGMARNCSVHAAGVVISPLPLKELVPLYKTNKDEIVTQYDMVGLEKLGLLKMDFLGLTTLDILQDALALIRKFRGDTISIEDLPLDDAATYAIFSKGFTSGVFQFESRGMCDILRKSQPSRLEDLCALNALYRPGPIQGGMVDDFIERKHGRRQVTYDFPQLKEILEETYGVIVYQEQVMQIANRLAGYSLGEADMLRRAMGKKKASEMAKHRDRFVRGAKERGFQEKKAGHIFDLMEQFAGYGFNKSHSAAYALVAFATAYLKAHYPVEFMSALLTSETGNTAKVVKYINECREMGIAVLPPDINSSDSNFTPVVSPGPEKAIRFGLSAIKNVGGTAVESIIKARTEGGPFKTIFDFGERVDLTHVNVGDVVPSTAPEEPPAIHRPSGNAHMQICVGWIPIDRGPRFQGGNGHAEGHGEVWLEILWKQRGRAIIFIGCSMRPFGFSGLRSLGNHVSVPIRPDEDGYLGRECPNSECEEYFKITPGTGITGPAPCHCPYCGHAGDQKTFLTRQQIDYATSVVKRKVVEAVRHDLKALEFEHKPRGAFGIGISLKLKPGAPVPIRWYREKNLETEITCDQCGLGYAIYGVFGWCPNCGVHNSLQILGKNLELAKKKLALAESVDKDLAETVVADALAGVVSAFDGFGRAICAGGSTRASFQTLEGGRKRVQQQFGFDMADALTEEEWRSACRSFQKRHLLAHRMGVIDEEYVQKVGDASAVVGRKVIVAPGEITALVGTVERMGKRLYEGVIQRAKVVETGNPTGTTVDPV